MRGSNGWARHPAPKISFMCDLARSTNEGECFGALKLISCIVYHVIYLTTNDSHLPRKSLWRKDKNNLLLWCEAVDIEVYQKTKSLLEIMGRKNHQRHLSCQPGLDRRNIAVHSIYRSRYYTSLPSRCSKLLFRRCLGCAGCSVPWEVRPLSIDRLLF